MYELKCYSLSDAQVVTFNPSPVDTLTEAKLVAIDKVSSLLKVNGLRLDHLRPPMYKAMMGCTCLAIVSVEEV